MNMQNRTQQDQFAGLFAAIDLLSEELKLVITNFSREESAPLPPLASSSTNVLRLEPPRRANHGRVPKGVKTPAEAFFIPILSMLAESEGSLNKLQILKQLELAMRHRLNAFDVGLNASNQLPRWHSNVDHARRKLVAKGFLVSGTSKSIWEISPKGREWVQRRS